MFQNPQRAQAETNEQGRLNRLKQLLTAASWSERAERQRKKRVTTEGTQEVHERFRSA